MKLRLASLALVIALVGTFAWGGSRAEAHNPNRQTTLVSLIQALVDVNIVGGQVGLVNVDRSLNNLRALNNFLNNNDIDITVQNIDVFRNANINVLNNVQLEALRNAQTAIGAALLGGDVLIFQRR